MRFVNKNSPQMNANEREYFCGWMRIQLTTEGKIVMAFVVQVVTGGIEDQIIL